MFTTQDGVIPTLTIQSGHNTQVTVTYAYGDESHQQASKTYNLTRLNSAVQVAQAHLDRKTTLLMQPLMAHALGHG